MNSNQRKFNERLKKKYRSSGTETGHGWHSPSYHKFFEGYEESVVNDKNGRPKIVRRYVGSRFEKDVSPKVNILLKVLYWILFIAAVALFVFGAIQNTTINRKWFMAVLQFISIAMLFWNLKGVFNTSFVPKSMTIGDYKSSCLSLKMSTWFSFGSLIADALLTIIYFIFDRNDIKLYVLSFLFYLISALMVFVINRIEYKLKYIEHKYEGTRDSEASEILY